MRSSVSKSLLVIVHLNYEFVADVKFQASFWGNKSIALIGTDRVGKF
jgi:hypothetical protein